MGFFRDVRHSGLSGVVLWFVLGACHSVGARERPNLLFIYTDDQSYRTLSCYRAEGAYDWVRTPNLDRLAARGVRFTHAYPGSWCVPSRFTALTGQHPFSIESVRSGLPYPRNHYDPERVVFWPRVFREEGYHTAMIGKWHTGMDAGFGREWDHQIVWNRPGEAIFNAGAYYRDQRITRDGGKPVKVKGYPADNYTEWAIDYLRDRATDPARPWALWLCYASTHPPFTPALRHETDYPGVEAPVPADIFPPRFGKPSYVQRLNLWHLEEDGLPHLGKVKSPTSSAVGLDGDALSDWARQYQQCVWAVDEGVGRILEVLGASGMEQDTLVVFSSDQGFALGQHGFAHKIAPYDANIRSPLIVSRPGTLPVNRVCRVPVGGVDLVATFYAQAGIDPPVALAGHDLTPLFQAPGTTVWPHPVLQCYTRYAFGEKTREIPKRRPLVGPSFPWWVSLVDGRYKYIRTLVAGEIEEIYDLREDPEELVNLALAGERHDLLRAMREALRVELDRTGAPFADQMPPTGMESGVAAGQDATRVTESPQPQGVPQRQGRWLRWAFPQREARTEG